MSNWREKDAGYWVGVAEGAYAYRGPMAQAARALEYVERRGAVELGVPTCPACNEPIGDVPHRTDCVLWGALEEARRVLALKATVRAPPVRGARVRHGRVKCDGCGWTGVNGQFWVNRDTGKRLCYGCILEHDREWYAANQKPSPMRKEDRDA